MSTKLILYSCYGCSCALFEEQHISSYVATEFGGCYLVLIRHCNWEVIKSRGSHIYCQCGYFLGDYPEDYRNILKIEATSVKIVKYEVG